MLKPNLLTILLYWYVKYIAFAIYFLPNGLNKSFTINDISSFFGYCIYISLFALVFMILFSAPMYFSFKVKNIFGVILLMGVIFVAEYFTYTELASESNPMNGIDNGVIGLLVFVLFFFKYFIVHIKCSLESYFDTLRN